MALGDYSRIQHGFWTDPDVKRVLTPEQKLLLLYYFSSPHANMIGLYHCPLEYAAGETGLSLETVRVWTFGVLAKFVSYDEKTEEILVHRGAEHNMAITKLVDTDKRVGTVRRMVADAYSERLRVLFCHLHADWPLDHPKPLPPKPEGPSEPLGSPPEAIPLSVAVAVTSQNSTESVSNETGASAEDFDDLPPRTNGVLDVCAQFMPLLRQLNYTADNHAASILRALDPKHSRDDIEAAIVGFAQMRDTGQLLKPLKLARDSPLPITALYAKTKGKYQEQHWWHQAQQEYWKNLRTNATGPIRARI